MTVGCSGSKRQSLIQYVLSKSNMVHAVSRVLVMITGFQRLCTVIACFNEDTNARRYYKMIPILSATCVIQALLVKLHLASVCICFYIRHSLTKWVSVCRSFNALSTDTSVIKIGVCCKEL